MRLVSILTCLFSLVLLPGCGTTRFGWLKPPDRSPPPAEIPTVAKLVDYLNDNASRIQGMRCEDISLTCSQGSQSFNLMAQMVVQKPRNFRMLGKVAAKDVVDLGSNDQEFWWWISQGDPYQFYCAYKDWNEGKVRNVNFPFQPEWIMETMGMGPYGPPEKYVREYDNDTVKLIEKTISPQGKAVRKVIVFQRRPKQIPSAQVSDFLLVDEASGKEICSAHVSEVQLDGVRTNAILPRKLELRWPEMKVRLGLKMDHVSVNPGNMPMTAFVRPSLTGIPSFNLATGRPDSPIQPVQGKIPTGQESKFIR
jgi:hypothetical protein